MKFWYTVRTKLYSEVSACASLGRHGVEVFSDAERTESALRKESINDIALVPRVSFCQV